MAASDGIASFMLEGDYQGSTRIAHLYANEHGATAERPQLIVQYVAPGAGMRSAKSENLPASVYPNPADGLMYFDNASNGLLSIVDLNGVVHYSMQTVSGQRVSVNTEEFPAGIYLLTVQDASKEILQKKTFSVVH